ncbi:glycoside hydrolase family 88 protein [Psychromonas algarum]|uniref:glycoside hydrolase family 88 protein n=1 Tax=Psychromonas algarum TaxID=2555643 RepID=UPI0014198164|nr:glycoside hydrolase family 88 protein [Psychromonas sp. RZ22]
MFLFPCSKKRVGLASAIPLILVGLTFVPNNSYAAQNTQYKSVMDLIESKSKGLAVNSLKNDHELFTDYTDTDGEWDTKNSRTWCSGFVPGIFWYLSVMTEDKEWKNRAVSWTEGVRARSYATDNDTGFQIFDSFGLGYTIGGENTEDYKSVMVTGAKTLVEERYNNEIGAFRSWKQGVSNPISMPFEVNIDQLMNMELVLWVGKNADKPEYTQMAISHADKTWANNVRENGSTYHVVSYNSQGQVVKKRTHQGWKTESTWSRGQAWAVYAYAMYYRYTGLDRMLERSKKSYQYYLEATKKQTNDLVPYADFDAPLDKDNPRDSSAAAIVASALIELYKITKEEQYLNDAQAMLNSLATPTYLANNPDYESILLKGSEKWGEPEVGSIFGDYFFVEALYRWKVWTNKPLPEHFGL